MAARLGVEPRQNESESFVLPLHHAAVGKRGGESSAQRRDVHADFCEGRSPLDKTRPSSEGPTMKDEMILVVRRELFDRLGAFQGLNFEVERYLPALLDRANNFFTPRPPAETDPSMKQIIPYVLLVHNDRVLHYVRGKKAGEQRFPQGGEG